MYRFLLIVFLMCLIICSSNICFAKEEKTVSMSFHEVVKKLQPSVVRIFGETNEEKIKGKTSDIVVTSGKKILSLGTGFNVSEDGKMMKEVELRYCISA